MGTGREVADICGLPSDFPLFQANSFLADCRMSHCNPFLVWPKLSKVSLGEEFHWRPPRNTYLLEKVVPVMQEMAIFPLSQSWIVSAGLEEEGWTAEQIMMETLGHFLSRSRFSDSRRGANALSNPHPQMYI